MAPLFSQVMEQDTILLILLIRPTRLMCLAPMCRAIAARQRRAMELTVTIAAVFRWVIPINVRVVTRQVWAIIHRAAAAFPSALVAE